MSLRQSTGVPPQDQQRPGWGGHASQFENFWSSVTSNITVEEAGVTAIYHVCSKERVTNVFRKISLNNLLLCCTLHFTVLRKGSTLKKKEAKINTVF
jgi:hypothetical protein